MKRQKIKFEIFKGTEAYKEILKRYHFKLDSIDKFYATSSIDENGKYHNNEQEYFKISYSVNDLYNSMYNELGDQDGIFMWNDTLIRFAKKHKKSILRHYKEQRDELESDHFNKWLNEGHGLDITDLICGEIWQKDEVLRLLACDFLRNIAYILFENIYQDDKKHAELIKTLKEIKGA